MTRAEHCWRWLALCASAALQANVMAAESLPPLRPPPDPASVSTTVLPEGAARSLVVRSCGICHAIELVVLRKRTADEWDMQIAKMVAYGARATDDEQEQIFQYLVTHFLKDASVTAPAATSAP